MMMIILIAACHDVFDKEVIASC